MSEGELIIKFLKKHILKTDRKWQVDLELGFRWFPNQFSQDIELIKSQSELITIKTNVLNNLELNTKNLQIIADLLFTSTMSAVTYEEKSLNLITRVPLKGDSFRWLSHLLGQAALLQIAEATYTISRVADAMEASATYKEHPASGPRLLLDNYIEKKIFLTLDQGKQPSKWEEKDFSILEEKIERPAKILTKKPRELSIEFPFGQAVSLCKLTSQTTHPRIGSGLTILQSFPLQINPPNEGIKLCLQLNNQPSNLNSNTYEIGSFCYRNGMINHICFISNSVYEISTMYELYKSCQERAKKLSKTFTGYAW
jgi:hypothetical protein